VTTHVLYHANCTDGFGAAWALRTLYKDAAHYVPVQYGSLPLDLDPKDRIIIVDFSYSREEIIALYEKHKKHVIVLDHHKTAEAALSGLSYCRFDMAHSGAILAWQNAQGPYVQPPQLLRYIEDRDLWKWELVKSREVSAALRSYPQDFTVWDFLMQRPISAFVDEGTAILRSQQQTIDALAGAAYYARIGGFVVPCLNASTLISELGEELLRRHKSMQFAAVWHQSSDGRIKVSLRSDDTRQDVSIVAQAFGGGGHRNAAGFTTETPPTFCGAMRSISSTPKCQECNNGN
jgi:oligoribonuclease NrnB/cAMP/cGMP phosphodiesterase (DHH superfamily)